MPIGFSSATSYSITSLRHARYLLHILPRTKKPLQERLTNLSSITRARLIRGVSRHSLRGLPLLAALVFVMVGSSNCRNFLSQPCRLLPRVLSARPLLNSTIWFAAGIFQSFIEAVQLVAEFSESGLFRQQKLLGFYFP
jgi:hypothetical protein